MVLVLALTCKASHCSPVNIGSGRPVLLTTNDSPGGEPPAHIVSHIRAPGINGADARDVL